MRDHLKSIPALEAGAHYSLKMKSYHVVFLYYHIRRDGSIEFGSKLLVKKKKKSMAAN